jgi:hypothetical protein
MVALWQVKNKRRSEFSGWDSHNTQSWVHCTPFVDRFT